MSNQSEARAALSPQAPRALLYTKAGCRFCAAARSLLVGRGLPFEEIDATDDQAILRSLVEQGGLATLPQLVVDGEPLGGFDEIRKLDRSGDLRRLLTGAD